MVVYRAISEAASGVFSGFFLSPKYLAVNMYEELKKHILCVYVSLRFSIHGLWALTCRYLPRQGPVCDRREQHVSSDRLQTHGGVLVHNLACDI